MLLSGCSLPKMTLATKGCRWEHTVALHRHVLNILTAINTSWKTGNAVHEAASSSSTHLQSKRKMELGVFPCFLYALAPNIHLLQSGFHCFLFPPAAHLHLTVTLSQSVKPSFLSTLQCNTNSSFSLHYTPLSFIISTVPWQSHFWHTNHLSLA